MADVSAGQHAHDSATTLRRAIAIAAIVSACLPLASCSLILSFEECTTDADCPGTTTCSDGICGGSEVVVSDDIRQDTEWTPDHVYVLDGLIYVNRGVTLTIRSGTTIKGREGSALVIERGGRLDAQGRANAPIVFTSSRPVGDRAPGDWGGVTLLGDAPVNQADANFEGLDDPVRGIYGGESPDGSCGTMSYVRIEFGGFPIARDEELNGLTLAGCGSGTLVEYVQVHLGDDDGVEVFGGAVNLEHIVITRAQDDGLDWDRGWQGTAQFIAIQQDANGDNGIEASNRPDNEEAAPVSSPQVYNVTMIGSQQASTQRAMTFKEGTAGTLANVLMVGHQTEAIDIRGKVTVTRLVDDTNMGPPLVITHSLLYNIGPNDTKYFPTQEEETEQTMGDGRDDDGGFDEDEYFRSGNFNFIFDENPSLGNPYALFDPNFVPSAQVVRQGIAPPPTVGDEAATYIGAFAKDDPNPWTEGWTSFPDN